MANYLPHTENDISEMLSVVGKKSLDDLYADFKQLIAKDIDLPNGNSQQQTEKYFYNISKENKVYDTIFMGAGAYNHYIPSVIKSIAARQEFLTAYTPYQPEISQGILQTIFEYQTMIARLTGMDLSNASVYDGATAFAEGLLMLSERKKNKVLLSKGINPQYIEVANTYFKGQNIDIEYIELNDSGSTSIEDLKAKLNDDVFAVAIAQPNFYGVIEKADSIGQAVKDFGCGYLMSVEPISCSVLKSPAECNADIATGEGQPLGMPLSFGGPYLGFIATKQKYMRRMVGRIVGKTLDSNGKDAFVLTLQAREQHIRREKASSSICSNQAYCALIATLYMATMGKKGIREVAWQCLSKAHYLAEKITAIIGYQLKFKDEFFNEFVVTSDIEADKIIKICRQNDILAGHKLNDNQILWCVTEMNSVQEMDKLVQLLQEVK